MTDKKRADHELLQTFKERMRIFHNEDDDNLNFILQSSQAALDEQLGFSMMSVDSGKELVIERSRFVYNDCLELFYDSFKKEIARLALVGLFEKEEKDEIKNN